MLLSPRTRRKRAACARIALAATLAVLLFTPRMDVSNEMVMAFLSPDQGSAAVPFQSTGG